MAKKKKSAPANEKVKDLENKIARYQKLSTDESVPQDERDFAVKKIEEMKAQLTELQKKEVYVMMTPDGPASAPKFRPGNIVKEIFKDGTIKGEFIVKSSEWNKRDGEYYYDLKIKANPKAIVALPESSLIGLAGQNKFSKKHMEEQFGKEFMKSKDKGTLKQYKAPAPKFGSDKSCKELQDMYDARRAASKKAQKKHKTTSVSEQLGDKLASAVGTVIDNIPAASIKASPKRYIKKLETVEKHTKAFLDSLKSILGDDFDREDLIEPFENKIAELIKTIKTKYIK